MKELAEKSASYGLQTLKVPAAAALDAGLLCMVIGALSFQAGGNHLDDTLRWVLVLAGLVALPAVLMGVYREPRQKQRPWQPLARLVLLLGFSQAAFFLLPWPASLVGPLGWQVPLCAALIYGRREAQRADVGLVRRRRYLVVGHGEPLLAVQRALAANPRVILSGIYPLAGSPPAPLIGPQISSALPLLRSAAELGVTDIVVASAERRGGVLPHDELLAARAAGVRVIDSARFFEREHGQVRLSALHPSFLIYGEGFRMSAARVVGKRVFDVIAALVLGLATAPLMLLTALAIVIDSKGPVFYAQERVGQGGRLFRVIKFRSMRTDAERDGTPRWAARQDPRITRVGRFIRRFRIDELPQLWNVLVGQMSLIGPRPERAFFVESLSREIPFYTLRHTIKPGLTGWAQVRYHYGDSLEDAAQKHQYDLYYLKHGSLVLDVAILWATVRVVMKGQGAH
ncbi:MAG: hypothetical protein RIR70_1031 [Pseudomonadota bacterium]|jgi:sugar transferase (PEP-CTERM system associated)